MSKIKSNNVNGFTLIEVIVTLVIVAILASTALPMLEVSAKRNKEYELRDSLRQIREGIDAYKRAADEGRIKITIEQTGYPPNLEILVNGVVDERDVNKKKIKFLRRIPPDPMSDNQGINTINNGWGLRSYISEPDKPQEGVDVYDVYSLSQKIGINGVPYAQW